MGGEVLSLCALSALAYGVCLCLGVHTIAKFKGQLEREEFVIFLFARPSSVPAKFAIGFLCTQHRST